MRILNCGLVVAMLGLASATGQTGAPMTAQQVVANSLKARGGAARFAAVHTLSFVGHLDLGGGKTAPLQVSLASHPNRIRVELSLPAGTLVQGYDGTQAWQIAPGQTTAEVLTGLGAKQVEDQALNFVDLLTAANTRTELLGQGTLDGHDYYKVGFTLPTGDGFIQYIDARTWLAFHEEYPGGVEDISDYRPVQGLLLPFRYVSGPPGQPGTVLSRESVQINPPLAATLFARPQARR